MKILGQIMNVTKLMDLDSVMIDSVTDLHHNSFSNDANELIPSCTYVFQENNSLIGYVEIDKPLPESIAEHILKAEYSEFLSEEELHLCHGLYLMYISVNPQFRGQGFGSRIMGKSIELARMDQRNSGVSHSVIAVVEGTSDTAIDAIYFFHKNSFSIIREKRVNESIDTYFQKDIP